MLLLSSCTAKQGPPNDRLESIKPVYTPKYGFRVIVDLPDTGNLDIRDIDSRWTKYESCIKAKIGRDLGMDRALAYEYYVVSGTWRCAYHDWCYAEVSTDSKRIWVSLQGLNEGLLEHEWAHLYRILNSKDELRKNEYKPAADCFYRSN